MNPIMKALSILCAALLLAACGDGDYKSQGMDPPAQPAPPGTPTTPTPPADAFLSQVEKVSAAMPDDTEADNVDAVTVSQPEDTEPKSL